MSTKQQIFSIRLNNLKLFGYHGLHEEEKILGNDFEVCIKMEIKVLKGEIISIEDSINYATVFEVVKQVFSQREDLLETICVNINAAIKDNFPQLRKISIQIVKLHPPIPAFVGSVSVKYRKKYD